LAVNSCQFAVASLQKKDRIRDMKPQTAHSKLQTEKAYIEKSGSKDFRLSVPINFDADQVECGTL